MKKSKRHDLAEEKLQRVKYEYNEDRMKRLDFINQRFRRKIKQKHISTILIKQWLSTISYLQDE